MVKEVEYFNEKITVSDSGEIIWNGQKRIPYLNRDGYPVVSIKTEKGWRSISVARLVALAFIENPNNYEEVNHKDYNRENYNINNLEWVTHADNVRYSVKNKQDMHGQNNPNYGNHKLSDFYKANPDIAKIKQGRPGKKNGRYIDGSYMVKSVSTIS